MGVKTKTGHEMSAKRITRRRFMQSAAALAAGAALPVRKAHAETRSGNSLPGRIVIWEDLEATSGSSGNLAVVQQMMDNSLMALTGASSAVAGN